MSKSINFWSDSSGTQARRMGTSVLLGSSLSLFIIQFPHMKNGNANSVHFVKQWFIIFKFTQWLLIECLLSVSHCLGPAPRFQRCARQIWSPMSQYSLTWRKRLHRHIQRKITHPTNVYPVPTMSEALLCNGYIYRFVVALKVITINNSLLLNSCTEGGWVTRLSDKWTDPS